MTTEICDECGFTGSRWTDQDATTTIGVAAALWRGYLEGLSEDAAGTRAHPDCWSIAEYTDHVRETLFGVRFLLDTALAAPGTDLGPVPDPPPAGPPREIDLGAAMAALADEASLLHHRLRETPPDRWTADVVLGGEALDVGWIARHAVHDATHHLHDVGRLRVELGEGAGHQTGRVAQLNVSGGGVPKRPVAEVTVGWSGPAADVQGDRRHHGRPFQALCLWSAEVIDALREEGHPIVPGSAGENVTISDLAWARIRPGAVVRIGEVLSEISAYAIPCAKNAGWFADGDWNRILHDRHPGWSRLYATVLTPGRIRPGDPVEVEP
jgi:MOSC domain-containing protein YiiM